MVGQSVEQRTGQPLGPEYAGPFVEWQIAGDDGGAALVALAEDLKQQLGAGRRQGYIAELIDDQQLVTGPRAAARAASRRLSRHFRWRVSRREWRRYRRPPWLLDARRPLALEIQKGPGWACPACLWSSRRCVA